MNARELARLRKDLSAVLDATAGSLAHPRRRKWCDAYVRGLLLDGHRKSVEPMAERLRAVDQDDADYEQALQQFVNQSPWDEQALLDDLQAWIAKRFGAEGFLIVDDTGFPKQGENSVGVARQYTGTLGKVANCQLAVTLQFATAREVLGLDAKLYLPQAWTDDRPRCDRAGVPADVGYVPKWKLALTMLRRADERGFRGPVLADSLYGTVTEFREALAAEGWTYCVGIDSTLVVIGSDVDLGPIPPSSGRGRKPTRPAKVRGGTLRGSSVKRWAIERSGDFRKVTWREGSKGKLSSRFAAWRVRPAHKLAAGKEPLGECWLLAEWPKEAKGPTKYFFSNLPAAASLKRLVATAKSRWPIEHSYRELKDELGLDHFEGRSWRGWHHHVVLVLLAYAFLQYLRRRPSKKGVVRRCHGCAGNFSDSSPAGAVAVLSATDPSPNSLSSNRRS